MEACDVTKLGCRLGRHLGFLPRIRNQVKTERIGNFFFLTCKIIQINIKYFASFYLQALILSLKQAEKHAKIHKKVTIFITHCS